MRRFLLLIVFLAAACCALFAYSRLVAVSPQAQAAALAGGRPFCVQVPAGSGYRPAGIGDGPGPRMWGRGGVHHAVLVIGDARRPETWHWSYLQNRFIEGSYGPHPIVCEPAQDYFRRPPHNAQAGMTAFTLEGRRLAIPAAYRARALWPGSMVGYLIHACPPDFTPAPASCTSTASDLVFVGFTGGSTPHGLAAGLADRIRAEPIEDREEAPGLLRPPGVRDYLEFGSDGTVRSYIACDIGAQCLHLFSEAGLSYQFRHPRAALPEWRRMQQRLIALHAGFEH